MAKGTDVATETTGSVEGSATEPQQPETQATATSVAEPEIPRFLRFSPDEVMARQAELQSKRQQERDARNQAQANAPQGRTRADAPERTVWPTWMSNPEVLERKLDDAESDAVNHLGGQNSASCPNSARAFVYNLQNQKSYEKVLMALGETTKATKAVDKLKASGQDVIGLFTTDGEGKAAGQPIVMTVKGFMMMCAVAPEGKSAKEAQLMTRASWFGPNASGRLSVERRQDGSMLGRGHRLVITVNGKDLLGSEFSVGKRQLFTDTATYDSLILPMHEGSIALRVIAEKLNGVMPADNAGLDWVAAWTSALRYNGTESALRNALRYTLLVSEDRIPNAQEGVEDLLLAPNALDNFRTFRGRSKEVSAAINAQRQSSQTA